MCEESRNRIATSLGNSWILSGCRSVYAMPVDRCNVFFYPRKERKPLLAGELRLLPGMKGSVFQYSKDFIANPNAIPLDPFSLPFQSTEIVTVREGESFLADAFSDAGPDAWGRAVIDRVAKLERSSEFDYLLAAGPNRTGALDFSIDGENHELVVAQMDDLADIETAIDQIRKSCRSKIGSAICLPSERV